MVTSMFDSRDVEILKATLAKGPTPGEWKTEISSLNEDDADDGGKYLSSIGPVESCDGCPIATTIDGEYIAACSPDRIAALRRVLVEVGRATDRAFVEHCNEKVAKILRGES